MVFRPRQKYHSVLQNARRKTINDGCQYENARTKKGSKALVRPRNSVCQGRRTGRKAGSNWDQSLTASAPHGTFVLGRLIEVRIGCEEFLSLEMRATILLTDTGVVTWRMPMGNTADRSTCCKAGCRAPLTVAFPAPLVPSFLASCMLRLR